MSAECSELHPSEMTVSVNRLRALAPQYWHPSPNRSLPSWLDVCDVYFGELCAEGVFTWDIAA